MTHAPTKNSETYLKPCPFCGSDARTDAGMGHARCSKTACELGKPGYAPWFTIDDWNTRAPVDLDSPSTEVTGTYPEPMTKNSETLKAWMLSGFTPCDPDDQGATFIVDGQWYAPMWGCDTLQVILETEDVPDTRAPERGEGQGGGKPFPELDQVINHIAPMLSGEKETGIDAILKRLDSCNEAGEIEYGSYSELHDMISTYRQQCAKNVEAAERFAQFEKESEEHWSALSRQSAVGGDWDGDAALLDTLLYAQGHGISNHAHSPGTPPTDILDDYEQSIPKESYYRQSLRVIRRALRATRTPEGEMCCRICIENISTDPNMRICQSCYDEHSAEPGFIEAVSGKTPPPRQTATGGITVEDVRFLLRLMPKWALEDEPGLDPTMYGTLSYEGDKEVIAQVKKIAALIERAGEEDHE